MWSKAHLVPVVNVPLAIAVAVLLWRSLDWPLIGDAAIFHFIAEQMRMGAVPYRDIYDVNMPLIYFVHAGIVAVVRAPDPAGLVEVIRALAAGGVSVAEVTLTVPNALEVVRGAKKALGDSVLLGAGTVLDPATWRALSGGERRAFYPGGYHLLLRDLDRARPIEDVIAWIRDPSAPLPSGAVPAARTWLSEQD